MISFYPGPSKVYEAVPRYVKEAYEAGLLGINHRSDAFMAMAKTTIATLKEKLEIPSEYMVFFTSSATECWEIIAQSLAQGPSYHYYNGAFGQKWCQYTHKITGQAVGQAFGANTPLDPDLVRPGAPNALICLTQSETSNGTMVSPSTLAAVRAAHPGHLIAVDATSSMAGIRLNFADADLWFASVQKCFGMPAGMAVMACSPAAISRALAINARDHYNSLAFMVDKMALWQTTHTPNVLGIYLLGKAMADAKPIAQTDAQTRRRAQAWYGLVEALGTVGPLIGHVPVRSHTVIAVQAPPTLVAEIKKHALQAGLLLGNGYGELANNTFRIANFPAINDQEISQLEDFLKNRPCIG